MTSLEQFGWNDTLAKSWQSLQAPGLKPGRVVADFGTSLKVAMPDFITAELSGKLAHYSNKQLVPKVGDWVAIHITDNNAVVEFILPRSGEIARKAAGNPTVKQVIAAHVDIAFVLLALDNDFSIDRLQRFLYQLSINNVSPVIVLNKADKTDNLASYVDQLDEFKLPILTTIANQGKGIDALIEMIEPTKTAILLGSSGVGKSTLTNHILGREAQKTQEIRASDDTGKHTTVHRELFVLPNGGLLIDTPGIRELQLWGTEEELAENFDDIAALALQCEFSSCKHGTDKGCAIQAALASGELSTSHYAAYLTMKNELVSLKGKTIKKAKADSAKAKKRSVFKQQKNLAREIRHDQYDN